MALSVEEAVDAARALITSAHYERAIPILNELNERGDDTPLSNELLGYCHTELRHFRLGEFHYARAVEVEAPTLSAILGLSDAYAYQFKTDDAESLLARVPIESLSPMQRGLVLAAKGNVASLAFRLEDAIQSYLQAVSYLPDMWTSWLSLGHIYSEQNRFDLATGCYEKAYELSKNFWTTFHLSVHYHLIGKHQEACELHEVRLREPKLHHAELDLPNWDGKPCSTLVVFQEGGLGDLLLHTRYVAEAAKRCERVIFSVWDKTVPLIEAMRLGSNVEVTAHPKTDYGMKRASVMSLPLYLGQYSPEEAPPTITLNIHREETPKPRIALTWFGDYKFPNGIARDAKLEDFEGLIRANPGFEWVTYSPEARAKEDIERLGLQDVLTHKVLPLEEMVVDLASCDLVISVDTAHVHLAGLVGVPTFMLVYSLPGVYWGLDKDTTPYYKNLTLFRQSTPRSWSEPIEEIGYALKERLQSGDYFRERKGNAGRRSSTGPGRRRSAERGPRVPQEEEAVSSSWPEGAPPGPESA